MNKFFKNTAAVLLAGVMSVTSFGTVASAYDGLTSESFSVEYLASVSKPTYSVKGAKGYRKIKLSTKTTGATIYYTTNGTTPSKTNGKKYGGGLIKITKNTKIKAIAIKGTTKSSVMTKTFYVSTKPGDVTGDGAINSTDYTRLKNYLAGKTSYVCKDNADTSGNGGVATKDLTLLKQYLDEEISTFPASKSSVTAPSITVYKSLGGKSFKLTASKGSIYYTTNGTTPSVSNGKKFTGSKVLVKDDCTVKYVTYYNGKYSTVKSKKIEVDKCGEVITKTDPNREYEDDVIVYLTSGTSGATIYYTTDGSDPRTSSSYRIYSSAGIKLTQDTTLRAYTRCKGYADSNVSTFYYKVKSNGFAISGYVWADTTPDGKKVATESGVSGVSVSLVNNSNNSVMSTTTTDSYGYYSFANAKKGTYYKVMFTYNGQKYRAYDYIVTGGNQALQGSVASDLVIKNAGAYSGTTKITSSNSYAKAITDNAYKTVAYTSATYTSAAQNVNLALRTDNYGSMKTTFTVNDNNTTAASGETVNYSLTLANTGAKKLKSAVVRVYIDKNATLSAITASNGSSVTTSNANVAGNYAYYDFTVSNLFPNTSAVYTVKTIIGNNIANETTIKHCAQVMEYSYDGSCYDRNIVPGNMTSIGNATQVSEAVSTAVKVGEATTPEELLYTGAADILVDSGKSTSVTISVTNAASFDTGIVSVKSDNAAVKPYVGTVTKSGTSAIVPIDIYTSEVAVDTTAKITITLASNTKKTQVINVTVKAAAPTTPMTVTGATGNAVTVNPNNFVTLTANDVTGTLTASSADSAIAMVTYTGNTILINGIAAGTTTVTIKDGHTTVTIYVTVTDPNPDPDPTV